MTVITDNSKVNYNLIKENKKLKERIEWLEQKLLLHNVSQQREPLKAFLTWFDADLSYLKDHNELIDDYFNSL
tara:strand:- start:365 stop:583 length:219 start_codon:yes stop_codon:yes gene_type:complete